MNGSDYIKLYALYEGDEFIDVGTLDEIAERNGTTKKTLYSYRTYARSDKYHDPRFNVYYVGKELKPMYERLIRHLEAMKRKESNGIAGTKRVASIDKHLVRIATIDEIINLVNLLKIEEDQYEEAERQGRYYQ
jgi:hypothetical protein